MLEKLYNMFLSDKMDLKERLFRIIMIVGTTAVGLAILQGLTLVTSDGLMWIYAIMFCSFVVAFISSFRFKNFEFASLLIGIVIIVIALPFIFFKGGGINSGSSVWLVLGIIYVFLMYSGKMLVFFTILTLLIDVCCYFFAYHFPDSVIELATRFEVHFDSAFAVLIVGLTTGVLLKFQSRIFEREKKLNDKRKVELEAISKSKDIFFASMSHEIRTPINSIVGLNELILRENPSEEIKEYALNIQNASKMLLSLVNDILDLSQLEIKKMELMNEEYSTYQLFHEIVDVMQVRMEEKKLKFMIEANSQIPAHLLGDERRIKQILINILGNAVKYTETGSVTLTCDYEEKEDGMVNLIISVADTGVGIRKEELEYLFDAFMRVDATRKIEGTGLGLSITKQLLDLMGGTISVDSIYTQGSVFTITIPQKVVGSDPMGEFMKMTRDTKLGAYYSKVFEAPEARVLIVDDDDLNLIITTKLLQETKMTIDTASSAEECLKKTKKRYYNVILVDYLMPDMDGGELLKAIRKQQNGLCNDSSVILLSANAFGDKIKEFEQLGFDGLLEKPIDAIKLEEEVMRNIPDELIEYRRDNNIGGQVEGVVSRLLTKKRKKIYVTSDSVCDIPKELLEKYDIKLIDLYIKTESGRFRDSKEIDVYNMSRFLSNESSQASSLSATVDEYEKFFAEVLTEAEEVIYIALASKMGRCFEVAKEAARGFSHVHVIDSSQISCGQGLIVLEAARMVKEGESLAEILAEIERIKQRIGTTFLLPTTNILWQNGYTDPITAKICKSFNLHPVLGIRASKVRVYGVRFGKLERAWRKYIRAHLRNKSRIRDNVIFIVYAGLNVRQQEIVMEEVRRCMKFEHVICTPASASNVCNAGLGSIGFAVYHK